jgi:tetratricopeptide (TPR) repeat protein
LSFSDDGRRLLSASTDRTVRTWDTETGLPIGPSLRHRTFAERAAFSPDDRRVAVYVADRTLCVWDCESGDLIVPPFPAGVVPIQWIWFSRDGRSIAGQSWQGDVFRWDLPGLPGSRDQVSDLVHLLTASRIDATDGIERLPRQTLRDDPERFLQAWLAWRSAIDADSADKAQSEWGERGWILSRMEKYSPTALARRLGGVEDMGLFRQLDQLFRQGAERLQSGDVRGAEASYRRASALLEERSSGPPSSLTARLRPIVEELMVLTWAHRLVVEGTERGQTGDARGAEAAYRQALALLAERLPGPPNSAVTRSYRDLVESAASNAFAWLWATSPDAKFRDGKRAVEFATRACELSHWKEAYPIGTLAAAHAEAGDFDAAVMWQEKAQTLYKDDKDREKGLDRLVRYKAHKPYRDVPKALILDAPTLPADPFAR